MIIAVDVVALYGLCAYGSRENLPLNGPSAGRPYLWTRWAAVQPDRLPGQALRPASAGMSPTSEFHLRRRDGGFASVMARPTQTLSIAATLVFVVGAVGLQAPAVTVLAFVPMLLTSIGYSELNKADPDCGATFTWARRAFGPRSGWAGGWAIIVADVLVMASLAQVAGQYVFFLFNADGIGADPASGWVLLVGVAWIAAREITATIGTTMRERSEPSMPDASLAGAEDCAAADAAVAEVVDRIIWRLSAGPGWSGARLCPER